MIAKYVWGSMAILLLSLLMTFVLVQAALADSILLVNKSGRGLTQIEIKFENSDGVFTIYKLANLAARDEKKIAVKTHDLTSNDGSYSLSFTSNGNVYSSARFGYGPAMSKTTVLITQSFDVMKAGQPRTPEPTNPRYMSDDLVLAYWVN